jgi:hypothetical protein
MPLAGLGAVLGVVGLVRARKDQERVGLSALGLVACLLGLLLGGWSIRSLVPTWKGAGKKEDKEQQVVRLRGPEAAPPTGPLCCAAVGSRCRSRAASARPPRASGPPSLPWASGLTPAPAAVRPQPRPAISAASRPASISARRRPGRAGGGRWRRAQAPKPTANRRPALSRGPAFSAPYHPAAPGPSPARCGPTSTGQW